MINNCLAVHFEGEIYIMELIHLVLEMDRFTGHHVVYFLTEY